MRTTYSSMFLGCTMGLLILAAGCDAAPEDGEPADQPAPAPERATTADAAAEAPDTTEEALWRHLQEVAYRENWALWPGTDRLYSGTEPHGMLLTTYVNETALAALQQGNTDMPAGAVIVKENFMPDSTFAAATVMYKVDGYNPDHEDWLFAKYNGEEGEVEAFGRAQGCQACHVQAENGYLYTAIPQ